MTTALRVCRILPAVPFLDPGATKATQPVPRLVVLSLGQWFALIAAHDRRHLWLAEGALSVGSGASSGVSS